MPPTDPKLTPTALRRAGLGAYFRPCDLEPLGITEPLLRGLVRRGEVERVARGLYRLVAADSTQLDSVAAVCARVPRGTVCLLTALQIHGIGTRLSPEVWIGIPYGQRTPRGAPSRIRVIRFSGAYLTSGVEATRIDGVPTRVTNPARTIIDCMRLTRWIDRETAVEAVREGLRTKKVSASGLLRMARECGAPERLRRDLEVLIA